MSLMIVVFFLITGEYRWQTRHMESALFLKTLPTNSGREDIFNSPCLFTGLFGEPFYFIIQQVRLFVQHGGFQGTDYQFTQIGGRGFQSIDELLFVKVVKKSKERKPNNQQ
jgi:hypothetical protein